MKLLIGGDFAPIRSADALIERGDFSFLQELQSVIADSDYSIINLESPFVLPEDTPIA